MPDAESQLATRRAWWRENRPTTKDLFDQELAVAIAVAIGSTSAEACASARLVPGAPRANGPTRSASSALSSRARTSAELMVGFLVLGFRDCDDDEGGHLRR